MRSALQYLVVDESRGQVTGVRIIDIVCNKLPRGSVPGGPAIAGAGPARQVLVPVVQRYGCGEGQNRGAPVVQPHTHITRYATRQGRQPGCSRGLWCGLPRTPAKCAQLGK